MIGSSDLSALDPSDPDDHARLLAIASTALAMASEANGGPYLDAATEKARAAEMQFERARANLDDDTIREGLGASQ